ncbi:MAG: isoprenylcysteine carboxylmethyltransferase family protein [Pseudomonadota bacterium]
MSRLSETYTQTVADAAAKDRSDLYTVAAVSLGGGAFLVVLPAVLFGLCYLLYEYALGPYSETIRVVFAWIATLGGLAMLGRTAFVQAETGKGTPVPLAPPRKLIVTGPYRYCRNPMQLGAVVYYFGLGTLMSSVWVGMLMFVIALLMVWLFQRFFEEPELEQRFGQEFREYRARTPFIFPKIR